MPYVSLLSEPNDLDQLQLVWQRLWLGTRAKSFWQSLAWLRVYWKHFCDGQSSFLRRPELKHTFAPFESLVTDSSVHSLKILSVESCDAPLGILPLVVRTEATTLGPLRVLTYPMTDGGAFFGPIGPAPAATLVNGLRFLREANRDWDVLELRGVNRDEVDFGRTRNALVNARMPAQEHVWRTMPVVDISNSWLNYWQTLPEELRRNVEAAQQLGDLTYERWRPVDAMRGDGEPRWELFEECLALATAEPRQDLAIRASYFRDLFGAAVHAGAFEVSLLRLDGCLIAFRFHLHTEGVLQELLHGALAKFSDLSPHRLLLAWTLKDSWRRRDTRFIFRDDSSRHDDSWSTGSVMAYRYSHAPRTSWRGQFLRFGQRLASRVW